jgi:carboxylate-amine ligase
VLVRALDPQLAPRHTAALVAAVHALARYEADAEPVVAPPDEILDEATFRAGRAGIDASLPDAGGALRPVAELTHELVATVRPAARELGCEAELDGLTELLAEGGGAGVQRAAYRDGGFERLLDVLCERAREGRRAA